MSVPLRLDNMLARLDAQPVGKVLLHRFAGCDYHAIVATLDDYLAVRALVADRLAEGVDATVLATVRETVQAVAELAGGRDDDVPVVALARQLALAPSAAWRRVQVALARGYLRNLEPRPRRPARLVPGEPLPAEQPVFPPPESLPVSVSAPENDTPAAPLREQGETRHDAHSTLALASDQAAGQHAVTALSDGTDGRPALEARPDGGAPREQALADAPDPRHGRRGAEHVARHGVEAEETARWEAV